MKFAFVLPHTMELKALTQGHEVIDDPTQQPGMSAPEIVDRLHRFAELGVTMTSVPIPPVSGVAEYLDYSQWMIEEIKPHVA
jgi:hypothetical protein